MKKTESFDQQHNDFTERQSVDRIKSGQNYQPPMLFLLFNTGINGGSSSNLEENTNGLIGNGS